MKKIVISLVLLLSLVLTSCSSVNLHIGENGNWWNGDEDLGIVAQGPQGEQGPRGEQGIQGEQGKDGSAPSIKINADGYWVINGVVSEYKAVGKDGANGLNGTNGINPTIEINLDGYWVINGILTEYKAIGEDGLKGADGTNGKNGTNGKSAYEIYISYHPEYMKTEKEWIEDLVNGSLKSEEIVQNTGDFKFAAYNSSSYYLESYAGDDRFVSIPATYNGFPVVCIGKGAFKNNATVEEIVMSNNIKYIEDSAFYFCSNLKKISISNNILEIAWDAFLSCNLLEHTEENSIKYLGNDENKYLVAISTTQNLTTFSINENTRVIADRAFAGFNDSGLRNIIIPNNVVSIGKEAFKNCSKLTTLVCGENLKQIGANAFNGCFTKGTSTCHILITQSVEFIGYCAFSGCSASIFVELPSMPETWNEHWQNDGIITCAIYWYSENIPAGSGQYWRYVDNEITIWE